VPQRTAKPYTSAQLINHPGPGIRPNVAMCDFSWAEYMKYVKSVDAGVDEKAEKERIEQVRCVFVTLRSHVCTCLFEMQLSLATLPYAIYFTTLGQQNRRRCVVFWPHDQQTGAPVTKLHKLRGPGDDCTNGYRGRRRGLSGLQIPQRRPTCVVYSCKVFKMIHVLVLCVWELII